MFKPTLVLLCLISSSLAFAAKKDGYNYNYNAPDSLFTREAPDTAFNTEAYPTDSDKWVEVFINRTYPNTVKIQNPGVVWNLADRSIQYTLDIISPKGFHNTSQEVLHCGSQKVKVLAYADTEAKRWIPIQKTQWKQVASALTSNDVVRYTLYRGLCEDGFPLKEEQLQERIKKLSFN